MPHVQTLHRYNFLLMRATAALAALCAVCIFLYGIFLLMAVAHTAARTDAERQITHITANLGELEARYLAQERSLTPEYAQSLGFVAPEKISSVYASAGSALTINTNR
jgi:hypothetical protein